MTQGPCVALHRTCETRKYSNFRDFFMTRRRNATQRNARIESESILALRRASTRRRRNVTQTLASYCEPALRVLEVCSVVVEGGAVQLCAGCARALQECRYISGLTVRDRVVCGVWPPAWVWSVRSACEHSGAPAVRRGEYRGARVGVCDAARPGHMRVTSEAGWKRKTEVSSML